MRLSNRMKKMIKNELEEKLIAEDLTSAYLLVSGIKGCLEGYIVRMSYIDEVLEYRSPREIIKATQGDFNLEDEYFIQPDLEKPTLVSGSLEDLLVFLKNQIIDILVCFYLDNSEVNDFVNSIIG